MGLEFLSCVYHGALWQTNGDILMAMVCKQLGYEITLHAGNSKIVLPGTFSPKFLPTLTKRPLSDSHLLRFTILWNPVPSPGLALEILHHTQQIPASIVEKLSVEFVRPARIAIKLL